MSKYCDDCGKPNTKYSDYKGKIYVYCDNIYCDSHAGMGDAGEYAPGPDTYKFDAVSKKRAK